jgi:choice-of-anchor B domain-containing protein
MKFFVFCFLVSVCGNFLFAQEQKNVVLLDRWFSDTVPTNSSQVRFSGCWGFTFQNNEYAALGTTTGTQIFELTSDNKLRFIAAVKGRHSSSQVITREFKTFKNYLYATCDEGPSSLQIIDLQYLPDSVSLITDLRNEQFGRTHNLFVDTLNELLYLCSVTPVLNNLELPMRPLCVYSLQNPTAPTLLWTGPNDIPEVHDIYVRDNIAILNCGFNGLRVYDFTNPAQPIYLNNLSIYPEQGYNHQGWLSPDGKTYVFADETPGTQIKKVRVDSNYAMYVTQLFGRPNIPYPKTAHNIQITNEFAFVAYYNDGLRIYDLRVPIPVEIGAYDTYQDNALTNNFSMWGAWGIYALFPSERIIVSDRNNGLFLFQFNREQFQSLPDQIFKVYPNPVQSNDWVHLRSPNDEISDFEVDWCDVTGRVLRSEKISQSSVWTYQPKRSGSFILRVRYKNYLQEEVTEHFKVVVV